jgi:thiol-disulfide isomerase/thioredoxin
MKKFLKVLAVFALLLMAAGAFVWFKFCGQPGADEKLTFPADAKYSHWVGKPAELDFTAMDGRKVSSADLRGKVVLLDFWATWCGPCMQSLDHLKATHKKFHPDGLEVVAINFDDDRAALESAVKEKELPWPQYFEGRKNSIGEKFGINHYPSVWLLDRAGNVRYVSALADTETKINTLLAESEDAAVAFGERANSGYAGRIKGGLATIQSLARERVRARAANDGTNGVAMPGGAKVPVGLSGLDKFIKVKSVMVSARPAAVLAVGQSNRYVTIGEMIRVPTAQGDLDLLCEGIDSNTVTLVEPKSGTQVELRTF